VSSFSINNNKRAQPAAVLRTPMLARSLCRTSHKAQSHIPVFLADRACCSIKQREIVTGYGMAGLVLYHDIRRSSRQQPSGGWYVME